MAVRKVWPENKPLTARFSVVGFHGDDESMLIGSIGLLKKMKVEGLDSVDVSIGFNTPEAKIPWGPDLLGEIAARVLRESGLPGTTSWYIDGPEGADRLIREGKDDLAAIIFKASELLGYRRFKTSFAF